MTRPTFLRGRVEESCAGTLLVWLVRNGSDSPAENVWDDPDALRTPGSIGDTLESAGGLAAGAVGCSVWSPGVPLRVE